MLVEEIPIDRHKHTQISTHFAVDEPRNSCSQFAPQPAAHVRDVVVAEHSAATQHENAKG